MNTTTTAMLVSFLASLAAVPAASASLDTQTQSAVNSMSPANTSAAVPVHHRRTTSLDGTTETIETAEGTITLSRGDDGFSSTITAPTFRVSVTRGRTAERRQYRSATRSYTVTTNRTGRFIRCRTRHGTLRRRQTPTQTMTDFTGSDRDATRQGCRTARKRLQQQARRITRQALRLGFIPPKITIADVNSSEESITLRSHIPIDLSLEDWTIRDSSGNSFRLSGMIQSDGSRTIYSGDAAVNCTSSCWPSQVWNDGGDTAYLHDSDGNRVDSMPVGG